MKSLIERVKNVLVSPKTEWQTIETENSSHVKVFTCYVALLALIPTVAAFIGYGIIGWSVFGTHVSNMGLGLRYAIMQYVTMLGGAYFTAIVINALSTNFGAQKDFNRAFSLVAYSYTPMFVAGVLNILPSLSWITFLAGLYGLYVLYIGLQPMMKVPKEKQTAYFVVSLIVMIVIVAVISAILSAILLRGFYGI